MNKIPYSPEELNIVATYEANNRAPGGTPKYNTPISPVENIRCLMRHETPCWLPGMETISINADIIPDNIARAFVQEAKPMTDKGGKDMFGVDWVYEPSANGSMVVPGNPILEDVNDWEEVIKFPDISTWDWEGAAKRNEEYLSPDAPRWATQFSGLFERLISFMDFENAAVALIDEDQEDAVHALFTKLTDLYIDIIDHMIKYFHIDGYTFHDDWAAQRSPFFSKEVWQEMIAPYVKKLVDHCHANNVIFELHSCGHSESIADAITSIGIDMWRPQPMNNIPKMYHEYGDKISFSMRPEINAKTPVEEQIKAAEELMATFNEPGKYVFLGYTGADAFHQKLYELSRKQYFNEK